MKDLHWSVMQVESTSHTSNELSPKHERETYERQGVYCHLMTS